MNYKRIRASFTEAKKEFYRNLYVREDVSINELGLILCCALSTEFTHTFCFIDGKTFYKMNSDEAESTAVSDLSRKFRFIYDMGEEWEFSCTISPTDYTLENTDKAVFIGGKGQGIWEDNKVSLLKYLNGEINPRSKKDNEEEGYFLPWNFSYAPYGFFSYPLDKNAEKKALETFVNEYLDKIEK